MLSWEDLNSKEGSTVYFLIHCGPFSNKIALYNGSYHILLSIPAKIQNHTKRESGMINILPQNYDSIY